jgi:predicted ribosome quality control (RQC) complex YloA/Tae2 family protein
MEGLALAAALEPFAAALHARGGARLPWRFPDVHTLVLPLPGTQALWIDLAPPDPRVAWSDARLPEPGLPTPFAALLAARAVGAIDAVEQAALDRRFTIHFAPGAGFVPTPAVALHVEVTGRHANAILVDVDGRILGAWREIAATVNRYREVRVGLPYTPPPPYEKLDPRSASDTDLSRALQGRPPSLAHRAIDGIGPRLTAAWIRAAGIDPDEPLAGAALVAAVTALRALAHGGAHAVVGDPIRARRTAREGAERERLRALLAARRALLLRRSEDLDDAAAAAARAEAARDRANLLLAHARQVPRGASRVVLEGFDGVAREIALDPALSPFQNAERLFERARRATERAERAAERRPALERALAQLDAEQEAVATLTPAAVAAVLAELAPPKVAAARGRRPGVWLQGPHGFEIVLGRTARENDLVTFQVGRSQDVWLHAQGVPGAHVIIRSGGREVPAETLRYAAELAAGQASVADEATALVDYTMRKHVWKIKGGSAGAVHYAQERTLRVAPRRLRDAALPNEG